MCALCLTLMDRFQPKRPAAPREVRRDMGAALYAAQQGETDPTAKPLKGFAPLAPALLRDEGPRCHEHLTVGIPGYSHKIVFSR
jgi:hypothetical protein